MVSSIDPEQNIADILIEVLIRWNVRFVFGVVGERASAMIEALHRRERKIGLVAVGSEQTAVLMACECGKHSGMLGVCLATTSAGCVRLLNGLQDAQTDPTPVLAITGGSFQDVAGAHSTRAEDIVALMKPVAIYNVAVNGPVHAAIAGELACQAALGLRGVAHLAGMRGEKMIRPGQAVTRFSRQVH
jgi:pyruvate dehydrogenase (quinone)